MAEIAITETQALAFRARRGHLAGPGARDVDAAARAILGAQAQQLPPALWALSLRTRGRPTADAVKARLLETGRSLVRAWGQRDTLHVFDAAAHWSDIVAARQDWAPGGRRGDMPPQDAVDAAAERLHNAHGPLTRRDIFDLLPKAYLRDCVKRAGDGDVGKRFAAGRILWRLALQGDACVAGKMGSEQFYASRIHGYPDLPWAPAAPREAAQRLAEDYLAVYGPATPQDIAHFFGARVRTVREWVAALEEARRVVPVRCGSREGLLARAKDARALRAEALKGAAWPVRLLPLWDSMLMGHADKSWTTPDEAERKLVWRKAAFVAAVVLARGRIVATWTQKVARKRVTVTVQPLGGWRAAHATGVRRDAAALAQHLALEGADVQIE